MGSAYSSDDDSDSDSDFPYVAFGRRGYYDPYDSYSDDDGYGYRGGSHGRRAEKSSAAESREVTAKRQFDRVRDHVQGAYSRARSRTVRLGCREGSGSPLSTLPEDVVGTILEFLAGDGLTPWQDLARPLAPMAARPAGRDPSESSKRKRGSSSLRATKIASSAKTKPSATSSKTTKAAVAVAAAATSTPLSPPTKCGIDRIGRIYEPGRQHVINLLNPSCHLTGPCWRDVGRYVRSHPHWTIKRIAATPAEKERFKETRQGTVYFVKAIFTVPGKKKKQPKKKKAKRPTPIAPSKETSAAASAARPHKVLSNGSATTNTASAARPRTFRKGKVLSNGSATANSHPQAAAITSMAAPKSPPPPTDVEMEERMARAQAAAGYVLPQGLQQQQRARLVGSVKPPAAKRARF